MRGGKFSVDQRRARSGSRKLEELFILAIAKSLERHSSNNERRFGIVQVMQSKHSIAGHLH